MSSVAYKRYTNDDSIKMDSYGRWRHNHEDIWKDYIFSCGVLKEISELAQKITL